MTARPARAGLAVVLAAAACWGAAVRAQDHAGQYQLADVEYGARLYAGHCINCHGESGDLMPGANLRSGRFRNAPTDRELRNLISDGLPGTAMVATAYDNAELTALVAYLRNMAAIELGGLRQGDELRGRELFYGKGRCDDCHRVGATGPRAAPDLTGVGAMRTAATLEQSLLDPEGAMQPINRPVRAVRRDGSVVNGRRLNEDTFTVQLIDDRGRLVSLDKTTLREYSLGNETAMPSYAAVFSEQERADLIAYLLSLKGD